MACVRVEKLRQRFCCLSRSFTGTSGGGKEQVNDEDHRAGRRALRSPRSPFSRCYKWHPASVTLVCDGGEELTLTDASIDSTCQCGADHSAVSNDIRAR